MKKRIIMTRIILYLTLFSFLLARQLEVSFISDENWLAGKNWGAQAFNLSLIHI